MLLRAVRRHKVVFGVFVVLGALAGAGFAVLRPPLLSSKVLVVAPQHGSNGGIQTQVVIAGSDPVLNGAIQRYPVLSLEQLRRQVKVTSVTASALAITVEAKTANVAQDAADAVARSYVSFVGTPGIAGGQVKAQLLCSKGAATSCATPATGTTVSAKVAETAGLGTLAGVLLGGIVVVSIGRTDRRLRERDEIAGAVGAPVLASVPVVHPSDTAGWVRLLEAYEPGVVHAWSLRKALRHVGVADGRSGGGGVCLVVVSLSADRGALAVGPQLAVYAASLGVPTRLVIGPQQDPDATAALSAACTMAAGSGQAGSLRFAAGDLPDAGWVSGTGLTVVVAVADSRTPRLAAALPGNTTVLSVSAGVATAEQLARAAVSITNAGVDIAGILVADPDPADRTTGRLLPMGQPARHRTAAHHKESRR